MSDTTAPAERITELAAAVTAHRHAYYSGAPTVSDVDYDALENELRVLVDEHPDLAPAINPLDEVGAPPSLHSPVRHARPMLSLEKATTEEALRAFLARFAGEQVLVMPKLDGVSLSLVYENGSLLRAATRGDGETGEDVTAHARALIDGVPARIPAPGRVEVRGEAVLLRSRLAAYNDAQAALPNGGRPLANARNGAAGVLRSKDPGQLADRRLAFVAFDVDGYTNTGLLFADLAALNFTAAAMALCATPEQAVDAVAQVERDSAELDFDIDGAVIRLADRRAYDAAGARSNSPRGAIAFKFAAEEASTRLDDVIWDVGKIGKVAPVAILAPVSVGGTTVARATLANQRVIAERGVRIGDVVRVKRAGEVIPHVVGADLAARTGDERDIVAPTHCPSCSSELVEEGNSRELYCTAGPSCPAQTIRRLEHWASRAAADIDAVGPTWITRLHDSGRVHNISDLYTLTYDELVAFDRVGETSARRVLSSIDASKQLGMRRALIGFAIRWASEGTAARLARAGYTSIEEIAAATVEDLQRVDDIGPKVAASLRAFFDRPETAAEIAALREHGVDLDVLDDDRPVRAAADAPLAGQSLVLTGAIVDPRTEEAVARPAFARLVEKAGATVASSVSATTTALVTGERVGAAKTAKAAALGVEVRDQAAVWSVLIAAGLA